jgi:ectoine hydroxylase
VDSTCLANALTARERDEFSRDGYFIVPAALDDARSERLRAIAAEHDAAYRRQPDVTAYHVLNEHDLVGQESEWLELIDLASTFPKVFDIMGWNIQLFHTQLLVTPPAPPAAEPGPYGWHQDNNRMNLDLDTAFHPMISLKIGYFLSALPTAGMANLCVIPGSHRLPVGSAGEAEPVELLADAGDAVVFDRRLWHSASTNVSSTTRTFVTYGYSYRWLRPKSRMALDELIDTVDPIRRQLLGWATSANGYFDPLPDDVPLREWIHARRGG